MSKHLLLRRLPSSVDRCVFGLWNTFKMKKKILIYSNFYFLLDPLSFLMHDHSLLDSKNNMYIVQQLEFSVLVFTCCVYQISLGTVDKLSSHSASSITSPFENFGNFCVPLLLPARSQDQTGWSTKLSFITWHWNW